MKHFAVGAFGSDEEAAAAGYPNHDEVDGARRYFRTSRKAMALTDEECDALLHASTLVRGPAVSGAVGRFLMFFGVVFILAIVLTGVMQGAEHRSMTVWLSWTIPGLMGGLTLFWVGRLVNEVCTLRGVIQRMSRGRCRATWR